MLHPLSQSPATDLALLGRSQPIKSIEYQAAKLNGEFQRRTGCQQPHRAHSGKTFSSRSTQTTTATPHKYLTRKKKTGRFCITNICFMPFHRVHIAQPAHFCIPYIHFWVVWFPENVSSRRNINFTYIYTYIQILISMTSSDIVIVLVFLVNVSVCSSVCLLNSCISCAVRAFRFISIRHPISLQSIKIDNSISFLNAA